MTTMSLEEAQARLPELFRSLKPGEVVVITDGDEPIGRLTTPPTARKLGTMRGSVKYMSLDFDAPLDDFKEYSG